MSNDIETATASCPHCASPTHEVPNPFYGTGMSVHEWLIVCDACSIARYKDRPDLVQVPPRDLPRKTAWSWLIKRTKRDTVSR